MTRTPQLFRLDASLAVETSVSRSVADTFEKVWRLEHPGGTVLRREALVRFTLAFFMGSDAVVPRPAVPDVPLHAAIVELVLDIAHNFLYNIFQCCKSGCSSILIGYYGHVHTQFLEIF